MITNYFTFTDVVRDKCSLYGQIPARYLSLEGQQVYALYKAVQFIACFASNATELLDLLLTDEDVAEAAKYAGSEYRKIIRCLERLVAEEGIPTA